MSNLIFPVWPNPSPNPKPNSNPANPASDRFVRPARGWVLGIPFALALATPASDAAAKFVGSGGHRYGGGTADRWGW